MKKLLQKTSTICVGLPRFRRILGTVLLFWFGLATLATGQGVSPDGNNILYVDRNVNIAGGGYTGAGNSWSNAIPQLADALRWAREEYEGGRRGWSSANPLRIFVAKGVYLPAYHAGDGLFTTDGGRHNAFVMVRDVQLYGGFDPSNGINNLDDERILPSVSSPGQGTVLSGDLGGNDHANNFEGHQENAHHVVISGGQVEVGSMDGFTISGGGTDGNNPITMAVYGQWVVQGFGAGLFLSNSSPSINNCMFYRNTALTGGAGIILGSASEPELTKCIFHGNLAEQGAGVVNIQSDPTFKECIFSENTALQQGGGMHNMQARPLLTNCQFNRNSADAGGGIANAASTSTLNDCSFRENTGKNGGAMFNGGGLVTLNGCSFSDNSATADGGGLHNMETEVAISKCVFDENKADQRGGAMRNDRATTRIKNSRIVNNNAPQGGGIINESCPLISVMNSTFSGNTAVMGAAMMNGLCDAVVVTNSTVSKNVADQLGGGLINVQSSFTMANTIIWANEVNGVTDKPEVSLYNMQGPLPNISNSLVANWGGSSNWNDALGIDGGGNIDVDPGFASVTPGDPNFLHLTGTSPAHDTGSNSAYTSGGGDLINDKDLAGNLRFSGSAIDLGAYEKMRDDMEIIIEAWTGETFRLVVFPSDAVAQVKHKIEDSKQIPVDQQTMVFDSVVLEDGRTLADYNIEHQSVIKLLRKRSPDEHVLYVDSLNGRDSSVGTTWATAFKTLSYALSLANTDTHIDSILVAKGTYYPAGTSAQTNRDSTFHIARGGVKLYGGYNATSGERNLAENRVILSGGIGASGSPTDNSYHVMVIAGIAADADSIIIDGFVIADGYANGTASKTYNGIAVLQNYGGGIYSVQNGLGSKLRMENLVIQNNQADFAGGVFNDEQSSPLVLNGQISGNAAVNNGGGILNRNLSSPQIINCTIAGNKAGNGGGIFNNFNASPVIRNSIVYGNSTGVISQGGSSPTVSYSLVQSQTGGTGNVDGTSDPGFISQVDYAQAPNNSGDYNLEVCSPAINVGSNIMLPDGMITDINGNTRITHSVVDLGASEYQGTLRTSAEALGMHGDQSIRTITGVTDFLGNNETCRLIARLEPTGVSPVSGTVTTRVEIDSEVQFHNNSPYVQRHYLVNAPADGSARLTLYFTQAEFDNFNIHLPTGDLPGNPGDEVNKVNLRIFKYEGATGSRPGDYQGTPSVIDPDDSDIRWNGAMQRWEVSFDVTGFSGFFIGSAASPLPVKLVSFSGSLDAESRVKLDWKVAEQQNIEAYHVQYSTNSRDFEHAGTVNATQTSETSYTFRHQPPGGNTLLYYRLHIVETDGAQSYSKIIGFTIPEHTVAFVYPNPVDLSFRVKREGVAGSTASLFNLSGTCLKTWTFKSDEQLVDVQSLTAGIYFVVFRDGTWLKVVKK